MAFRSRKTRLLRGFLWLQLGVEAGHFADQLAALGADFLAVFELMRAVGDDGFFLVYAEPPDAFVRADLGGDIIL